MTSGSARLLGNSATLALALVALGTMTVGLRLVGLDHTPFVDEFHHILAAESLLHDGDLSILDGDPYQRGRLFTYVVGGFMWAFGPTLVVARLPAVISGTALVLVFFLWLRSIAGNLAGWTGALLLSFAPVAVFLSQWSRFYTFHALLFWLGVVGFFRLFSSDPPRHRVILAAASAASLLGAFHLQPVTLIGVTGLGLWMGLLLLPGLSRWLQTGNRRLRWAGIVVAFLLLIVAAVALGLPQYALTGLRQVDHWAVDRQGDTRYFHVLLEDQYGPLWAFFPFALIIAFAVSWRAALLLACMLGASLFIHSLSAWKAERYFFYALPCLFAVWGLAVARFVPWLRGLLDGCLRALFGNRLPEPARRAAATALLVAAALFAFLGIEAFAITRSMLIRGDEGWVRPAGHRGEAYRGESDWAVARAVLAPIAHDVAAVVSSSDLKAVYYLDRLDFILYSGHLMPTFAGDARAPEFTRSSKVGRPIISSPDALALIIDCYRSGLIVAEQPVWGWDGGVPSETAALIEERTSPLSLPAGSKLLAYVWTSEVPSTPDGCAAIPRTPATSVRRPIGAGQP